MSDNQGRSGGGGNTGLAVLVGALIVAVLVIAFFLFGGEVDTAGNGDINVDVEAPSAPTGGDGGGTGGNGGGETGGGNQ